MSNILDDRKYTKTHEWVMNNGDGTHTMGITDNAQEQLGDMVFVELPNVGDNVDEGDDFCVIESVKAASDVYAPADLKVVAVNKSLESNPELINSNCYDDGYLLIFSGEADDLLSAKEYQNLLDDK